MRPTDHLFDSPSPQDRLPADRRVRLYLGIARRLRKYPDARNVRRAAIEKAWEARCEMRRPA